MVEIAQIRVCYLQVPTDLIPTEHDCSDQKSRKQDIKVVNATVKLKTTNLLGTVSTPDPCLTGSRINCGASSYAEASTYLSIRSAMRRWCPANIVPMRDRIPKAQGLPVQIGGRARRTIRQLSDGRQWARATVAKPLRVQTLLV